MSSSFGVDLVIIGCYNVTNSTYFLSFFQWGAFSPAWWVVKKDDIKISQTAQTGQWQIILVILWACLSIRHLQGQNHLSPSTPSAHVPLSCHKCHSFTVGNMVFKRQIQVPVKCCHIICFTCEPSDCITFNKKKSIFYDIIPAAIKTGFIFASG